MFKDNAEKHRFEWTEDGELAFADYRKADGFLLLPHVEAAMALRGTGAAARLMQAVVDHAREKDLKLRPLCSYAVAWFRRHPDAQDVVA